jgi:hypothetical protein
VSVYYIIGSRWVYECLGLDLDLKIMNVESLYNKIYSLFSNFLFNAERFSEYSREHPDFRFQNSVKTKG